ncbi:hypothetical protein HC766_09320 [Candidatus Gracilibacteria bacterium]|nr:hypothetical protein [Candidatus Gracilibacteria bacterium]
MSSQFTCPRGAKGVRTSAYWPAISSNIWPPRAPCLPCRPDSRDQRHRRSHRQETRRIPHHRQTRLLRKSACAISRHHFGPLGAARLGCKKNQALHDQLQVSSLPELEAACKDGRVAALAGFGKKTADNLLKALEDQRKHAGSFRIGSIAAEARAMLEDLQSLPQVHQAAIAGSFRRRKEIVRDLDFITATSDAAAVSDFS